MGLTDGVLRVSGFGLIFGLASALRRRSRSVLEMPGQDLLRVRLRVCNAGTEHFLMSPLSEGSVYVVASCCCGYPSGCCCPRVECVRGGYGSRPDHASVGGPVRRHCDHHGRVPGPDGVAFSPDGTKAYVANAPATPSVLSTPPLTPSMRPSRSGYPAGVAVSPDGTKVYVANFNSNSVSVINTTTNAVDATITVGTEPLRCGCLAGWNQGLRRQLQQRQRQCYQHHH